MYAFVPRSRPSQKRRAAPQVRRGRAPSARKELVSMLTALAAGALAGGSIAGVLAAISYGGELTRAAYDSIVDWLWTEKEQIEMRLDAIEYRIEEIAAADPMMTDPVLQQEEQTLNMEQDQLTERLMQIEQAEYEAAAAASIAID